jgi:nitrite reductase/ring-hydroxylating ferredoxin subunit
VPDPDLSRRRALTGVAVGGLTLPLLAACGSGSSSSAGARPPSGSSSLVPKAQVPVGGGVILRDQNIVVTQPSAGTFEGFDATCTHQGCQLASVSAGTINCGCHGSQFSIKDGSNVVGPSGTPAGSVAALGRVPVKVKGADIVEG